MQHEKSSVLETNNAFSVGRANAVKHAFVYTWQICTAHCNACMMLGRPAFIILLNAFHQPYLHGLYTYLKTYFKYHAKYTSVVFDVDVKRGVTMAFSFSL